MLLACLLFAAAVAAAAAAVVDDVYTPISTNQEKFSRNQLFIG